MIKAYTIQQDDLRYLRESLRLSNVRFLEISINRYRAHVTLRNSLYKYKALIVTDLKKESIAFLEFIPTLRSLNKSFLITYRQESKLRKELASHSKIAGEGVSIYPVKKKPTVNVTTALIAHVIAAALNISIVRSPRQER